MSAKRKRLTRRRLEAMRTVLDWALAGWADDGELALAGVDANDVHAALVWTEQRLERSEGEA